MKTSNSYRQQVAATLAKLNPTLLEAAIAASKRLAAGVKAEAKPSIEVDQSALQRVQEGQDQVRRTVQEELRQ